MYYVRIRDMRIYGRITCDTRNVATEEHALFEHATFGTTFNFLYLFWHKSIAMFV